VGFIIGWGVDLFLGDLPVTNVPARFTLFSIRFFFCSEPLAPFASPPVFGRDTPQVFFVFVVLLPRREPFLFVPPRP